MALLVVSTLVPGGCRNSKYRRTAERRDTLCMGMAEYSNADTAKGRSVRVKLKAVYPSPITGPLSANIAAWVRSSLGIGTPADTMDAKSVVNYYGGKAFANLVAADTDAAFYTDCRVETMRRGYVSLRLTVAESSDDTPGVTTITGVTMRRSDGAVFGWNMINDTTSKAFRKLMSDGVKRYMQRTLEVKQLDDEDFRNLLLPWLSKSVAVHGEAATTIANGQKQQLFPVPRTAPFLSQKGITFVYQPCEVAPYSAGTPVFTVPFSKAEHFMTKEAKKLLEKEKAADTAH